MKLWRWAVLGFAAEAAWLGGAGAAEPPKVAAAWAAGPMEARVAFEATVDPSVATSAVGAAIEFTDPAGRGRPGPNGSRGTLRVAAARLEDGGRTLVLTTDPHPREARYSLSLPGVKAAGEPGAGSAVAASYDLNGVEVAWRKGPPPAAPGADESNIPPAWAGWWPEINTAASRAATRASAEHERFWAASGDVGRVALRAFVAIPAGTTGLTFDASGPFRVTVAGEETQSFNPPDAPRAHRAAVRAEAGPEPVELAVTLATGGGEAAGKPVSLQVEVVAEPGAAGRPLPRASLVLPWAPPTPAPATPGEVPAALLTGGDPKRGEAVFRGETAKCANCHAVRGVGPTIGPDLGHLAGADRAWAYQQIAEPSASIHPEFVAYTVAFKDGRVAMGVVRADGPDHLRVSDIDAKATRFPTAEVEELRPSSSSIMPVGLLGPIGEDGVRDLLAFLTAPAPAPASGRTGP